jgi:hypothetical protein
MDPTKEHMNDEINPNHPVLQQARAHWHKIAALIMINQGRKQVLITQKDIDQILKDKVNIVLDCRREVCPAGGMLIRLVDDVEAAKLAKEQGGLPIDS